MRAYLRRTSFPPPIAQMHTSFRSVHSTPHAFSTAHHAGSHSHIHSHTHTYTHLHTPTDPFLIFFLLLLSTVHSRNVPPANAVPPLFTKARPLFLLRSAACCVRVLIPSKAALRVRFGPHLGHWLWHASSGTQTFHMGCTVTGGDFGVSMCACGTCACVMGQHGLARSCVLVRSGNKLLSPSPPLESTITGARSEPRSSPLKAPIDAKGCEYLTSRNQPRTRSAASWGASV